tara:strand:- start:4662 stop:5837 length:1176 start_codon:yes stop_codon:yes gene_type:complete
MINYGKQFIDQSDIEEVKKVLEGDWLTQGPHIENFENKLSSYFNAKYVCAVSNGTAALHLAGHALGWGENDLVITSPITFLATANSIIYSGAKPDFVDIDAKSYTLDLNKLEDRINFFKKNNKSVKAIIGVDYAGHPCNWEELSYLSKKYNIQLINDNCHALGAEYNGDKGYAVKFADIVTQSYHPVKHITTGEGGSILTNNASYDKKVRLLRSHGMVKEEYQSDEQNGPWYYEMHELGYNYRITDMQSALGTSQLKKLDEFIIKRRSIAMSYNNAFKSIPYVTIPYCDKNIFHSYHLYPLLIDFKKFSITKIEFFIKMKEMGINLQVHYIPIHFQPYYSSNFGFQKGDYPISESFYQNEVSLPIYPGLENEKVDYVINCVKNILANQKNE